LFVREIGVQRTGTDQVAAQRLDEARTDIG
jgi:hypothetical protein